MNQYVKDEKLGRTHREYLKAKSDFEAIRKRHVDLVAKIEEFFFALKRDPFRTYAKRGPQGTLQVAIECGDANYFYGAALADQLSLNSMGNHLDEYRAAAEAVKSFRRSLIEQGEDDPDGVE